jgi:WD40 repeat protein
MLSIWKWTNGSVELSHGIQLDIRDDILSMAILSSSYWLSKVYNAQDRQADYCLRNLKSQKVIARWPQPRDWFSNFGRKGSQNGKHWAVSAVKEATEYGQPDTMRFGLIAPDGKTFDWAVTIKGDSSCFPELSPPLVPSDDGSFIGIAGWKNGVLMMDVANKKVLWTANGENKPDMTAGNDADAWRPMPLDEINTRDIAFSPDSKIVYAGGTTGCVYALKVKTGEVVSKWWATPTSEQINGYRISTISVSPDGRFVAAGTGPTGDVYLFSTKDGERRILKHGGSTILITSFSPDSKRLATFATGQIKIWKLPEETERPKSETNSSDKQTTQDATPVK